MATECLMFFLGGPEIHLVDQGLEFTTYCLESDNPRHTTHSRQQILLPVMMDFSFMVELLTTCIGISSIEQLVM